MKDLTILLENRPGALAEMGEALGRAGVSIEGGGAFLVDGVGIAHFLFEDGPAAREALEARGIRVLEEREVLVQRLSQEEPGQLGKLTRRMAEAGVNIETLYSDHNHQMILAVSDFASGRAISEVWEQERLSSERRAPALLAKMAAKHHSYAVQIDWTGNDGKGTKTYRSYRRDYTIASPGKAAIQGSSDPAFRGDPTRFNPEELLVASLSSCHMLWYLHLCSTNGVTVLDYQDHASGVMAESTDGSGAFTGVRLSPRVTISDAPDEEKALSLHHEAHNLCFIARSVNFPVDIAPTILIDQNSNRAAS